MSIREVLVATDFSENADAAVCVARDYAERFGARLHLLHVLGTGERGATQRLAQLSEGLGPTVAAVVAAPAGDPARELTRVAREHDIDLIVVGTHGRTGMSRALLGSVAERVVRTASCPVLSVPVRASQPPHAEAPIEAPVAATFCVVCRAPSADLICEPCRARIRGEALRRKQQDERAGRTTT
jgi:universal stress protein A